MQMTQPNSTYTLSQGERNLRSWSHFLLIVNVIFTILPLIFKPLNLIKVPVNDFIQGTMGFVGLIAVVIFTVRSNYSEVQKSLVFNFICSLVLANIYHSYIQLNFKVDQDLARQMKEEFYWRDAEIAGKVQVAYEPLAAEIELQTHHNLIIDDIIGNHFPESFIFRKKYRKILEECASKIGKKLTIPPVMHAEAAINKDLDQLLIQNDPSKIGVLFKDHNIWDSAQAIKQIDGGYMREEGAFKDLLINIIQNKLETAESLGKIVSITRDTITHQIIMFELSK